MADPAKNFAKATVSLGYDADDTTIVLQTGHGAKLPQPSTDGAFNLVWWNASVYADPADDPNVEVVRCTARTADTLTITRAQEGTTATAKNTAGATYRMILGFTKKMYDDLVSGASSPNLWATFTADDASSTTANTTTDNLTVAGGTGISTAIVGDTLTITNDSPNADQNLWATFLADDANTTTANTTTDTLTVSGANGISTSIAGDTLTIDGSGISASPGGSDTQIQGNNAGAFDGTKWSYNFTSHIMSALNSSDQTIAKWGVSGINEQIFIQGSTDYGIQLRKPTTFTGRWLSFQDNGLGTDIAYFSSGGRYVTASGTGGGLGFGDNDTYIYESTDDTISFTFSNSERYRLSSTGFSGLSTNGPQIRNETASATNPTLLPSSSDLNTGIGWQSADKLSLIAGGTPIMIISDLGASTENVLIQVDGASEVGLAIKGTTSQLANLFEARNIFGAVGAIINSDLEFSNTDGQTSSEVFGDGALAGGSYASAFGYNAQANAGWATALGYNTNVTGAGGVAIGNAAGASIADGIAIGTAALASGGSFAISIGVNSDASAIRSVAIGNAAQATGEGAISFGDRSSAGIFGTAVGALASASGYNIAIGLQASASTNRSIAIGSNSSASNSQAIAIGRESSAGHAQAVALGYKATTTAANQLMIGSSTANLDIYHHGSILTDNVSLGANISANYVGLGINRNLETGAIFDSGNYAFQMVRLNGTNRLDFQVYSGAGATISSQALTIDSSARVAINTTSISEQFGVNGHSSILNGNDFRLYDSGNSHYTGFVAPALTSNRLITLPSDAGTANDRIVTNGSGTWSYKKGTWVTTTLGAAATTFAATSDKHIITGDAGGNTLATITGGYNGQELTLLFTDGLVTITDTDAHTANTIDLQRPFVSADDATLTLAFDGTSWYEISRQKPLAKAKMTRDAAQSIPDSTWEKIAFDNIELDTTGIADATTNDRFDIVEDGVYFISASWTCPNLDPSESAIAAIYLNGSAVADGDGYVGGTNDAVRASVNEVFELSTGEYIEFYVRHNEGASQNTYTDTSLKPRMSVIQLA